MRARSAASTRGVFWVTNVGAQHVIRNDGVTGSSPVCGTT
jgi:hypothetical protein